MPAKKNTPMTNALKTPIKSCVRKKAQMVIDISDSEDLAQAIPPKPKNSVAITLSDSDSSSLIPIPVCRKRTVPSTTSSASKRVAPSSSKTYIQSSAASTDVDGEKSNMDKSIWEIVVDRQALRAELATPFALKHTHLEDLLNNGCFQAPMGEIGLAYTEPGTLRMLRCDCCIHGVVASATQLECVQSLASPDSCQYCIDFDLHCTATEGILARLYTEKLATLLLNDPKAGGTEEAVLLRLMVKRFRLDFPARPDIYGSLRESLLGEGSGAWVRKATASVKGKERALD